MWFRGERAAATWIVLMALERVVFTNLHLVMPLAFPLMAASCELTLAASHKCCVCFGCYLFRVSRVVGQHMRESLICCFGSTLCGPCSGKFGFGVACWILPASCMIQLLRVSLPSACVNMQNSVLCGALMPRRQSYQALPTLGCESRSQGPLSLVSDAM